MRKNKEFDLEWWANSEHGGAHYWDGYAVYWADEEVYPEGTILGDYKRSRGHQVMWCWQSLRDFAYLDIQET